MKSEVIELIAAQRSHLDGLETGLNAAADAVRAGVDQCLAGEKDCTELSNSLHGLAGRLRETGAALNAAAKTLDDVRGYAIVIQRQLSHIESVDDQNSQRIDFYGQALSALLRSGVRLASALFPPEEFQSVVRAPNDMRGQLLLHRWNSWLSGLAEYVDEAVRASSSLIAHVDEASSASERVSALRVANQHLKAVLAASFPEPAPTMRRIDRGPLGDINFLCKDGTEGPRDE